MKARNDASRVLGFAIGALVAASSFTYLACDSESAVKEPKPGVDSGAGTPNADAGVLPDGALADGGDCVMNPKTHLEIINACTDAVKITKTPTLPLLLADGGLPPLP